MAATTICSDFWAQKNKVWHCFHCSPSICYEVMGPDAMILVFWILNFKPTFSLSFITFIKRLFSSSSLSPIRWCHLHIWGYWYFSRQTWFQPVLLPAQRFSWCTLHISTEFYILYNYLICWNGSTINDILNISPPFIFPIVSTTIMNFPLHIFGCIST